MKRLRALLAATAIALCVLGAAEVALRLAGFTREVAPLSLRFGYPNPREIAHVFQPDPRLFWRLRPGTEFDAEGRVAINARGYRGPLPRAPRPSGLLRIAVLGDSVAFGSATAWPEILEEILEARRAPGAAEVLNFGVPGYTVVQGLRQLEDEVLPLAPDVVVLAYGWNDHWLAHGGLPDAARAIPPPGAARLALALSRLRLAQALSTLRPRAPAGAGSVRRVPPETFRRTLRRMIDAARGAGAHAVVVSLPSALSEEEIPGYLLDQGFTPSARAAVADHAAYAALAGEEALGAGAAFVATQGSFADPALFTRDRIHLSARGHRLLAELVAGALP